MKKRRRRKQQTFHFETNENQNTHTLEQYVDVNHKNSFSFFSLLYIYFMCQCMTYIVTDYSVSKLIVLSSFFFCGRFSSSIRLRLLPVVVWLLRDFFGIDVWHIVQFWNDSTTAKKWLENANKNRERERETSRVGYYQDIIIGLLLLLLWFGTCEWVVALAFINALRV